MEEYIIQYVEPEVIDYTNQIELLEQELINIRELQVTTLNNVYDFASITIIFFFLLIACIIGLNIIKVAFKHD